MSTDDENVEGFTGDEFDRTLEPFKEDDGDMITLENNAIEVAPPPSLSVASPAPNAKAFSDDVVPKSDSVSKAKKATLSLKKMRAIRRKAPVQVRIYTEPRKVRTPFDNYVCAPDIFWSSIQGNMLRLRHLILVEGISVHTTADPWMVRASSNHILTSSTLANVDAPDPTALARHFELQTSSHPRRAAKGGVVEAVEFLLAHGADVYTKDDAAIALLKAGDLKDLLIADYDANLNSLEWATVRSHTTCVRDLIKYTDTVWLPGFVADLIWRIILKTKMKTAEEKRADEKLAAQRAEYQRLQALAEQAKNAAQLGEAVVLDRSDVARIDFSVPPVPKK
ncbi:hypothetical protein ACHHYP_14478 [Achlya hypogyna]|uniref:Ankyrin repeat protein n=1 Tax=Achlya hypogyna TaxID=1202772 RepID=A0A1V9YD36_ACHHY|nr:hypothetical protein ACHHYP_14478 [Achlya hypogyna]